MLFYPDEACTSLPLCKKLSGLLMAGRLFFYSDFQSPGNSGTSLSMKLRKGTTHGT